jgi:1-aminocyclopropane-1-carboxylate deaminase/D-cysteine desulfhydrase-like pyridoxal-dependent ACC family enzyme
MIGFMATALAALMSLPAVTLATHPSPVDRMTCLEQALGRGCPKLFVKRDDLLSFARGGNKVRKLQVLASEIARLGADTVITCGAIQSNHARVTAAAGAMLGWRVILVLSGVPPERPTANLRLDHLFGADVRLVATRDERDAAMAAAAAEVEAGGGRPCIIPLGGSTPLGAMGMARAVAELSTAGVRPDVILHASSSGGTQAGLTAGCALLGVPTRVVGVSADEPADALHLRVAGLLEGMAARLGARAETLHGAHPIEVDASQVGAGYEQPTEAAAEAMRIVARAEGIVLDPVYTAKAMASLIARVRAGAFAPDQTVLFWHTGGLSE